MVNYYKSKTKKKKNEINLLKTKKKQQSVAENGVNALDI